jgi:hypothetical protein
MIEPVYDNLGLLEAVAKLAQNPQDSLGHVMALVFHHA